MAPPSPQDTAVVVVAQARRALQDVAVPENAPAMAAYMKTDQPFLGVRAADRRGVERKLRTIPIPSASTYRAVVQALWREPEREVQLLAIDVAVRNRPYITFDQLDLFEQMVREGQWWDLVDPIAADLIGRVWQKERDRTAPIMDAWITDDCPWIRRAALLGQLKHKSDTDARRLFDYCLQCASETGFFTRKAIGWALRTYGDSQPRAVEAFLTEHWDRFSGLSQREAARKLRAAGWSGPHG